MDMDNESFLGGLIVGAIVSTAIGIGCIVIRSDAEVSGYKDKMILEYHCPGKEYERKLFRQLLEVSNVETNFIDRQYSMDKHRVELRLTNPSRNPNDN